MTWLSSDGLRAGTRVLQECIFLNKKILRINSSLLISGSRFEVLVCTTFFVESSFLMVACRRSGIISNIVVEAVAARPEVVVVVDTRGIDACIAELLAKVGDGNLKLGEVLKGNDDLCVSGRAVVGEGTIGRSGRFK